MTENVNSKQTARKRQRVTSSCAVCRSRKTKCDKKRPVCSSCVKLKIEYQCAYEVPQWVNSTPQGKPKVEIQVFQEQVMDSYVQSPVSRQPPQYPVKIETQNPMLVSNNNGISNENGIAMENGNGNGNGLKNGISSGKTPTKVTHEPVRQQFKFKFRDPLTLEANKMTRKKLSDSNGTKKSKQKSGLVDLNAPPEVDDGLAYNFANSFYPFISGSTDLKPLSQGAIISKDPFLLSMFTKFNNDYKFVQEVLKDTQDPMVGINTMKSILAEEHSRYEIIELYNNVKNSKLNGVTDIHHSSTLSESFMPIKNSYYLNSFVGESCEALNQKILNLLPSLKILRYLWKLYILYVAPLVPIMDVNKLSDDLSDILCGANLSGVFQDSPKVPKQQDKIFDPKEEKKLDRINITAKRDYGKIGIFLVGLRLAFLAIKINVNDVNVRCHIENEILSNSHFLNDGVSANGEKTKVFEDLISHEYIELAQVCMFILENEKDLSFIVVSLLGLFFDYVELQEEGRKNFGLSFDSSLFNHYANTAKNIGLHKDFGNEQLMINQEFFRLQGQDVKIFSNLNAEIQARRKLWHYLLVKDSGSSVYYGKLLCIGSAEEYDTKLPDFSEMSKHFFYPHLKMIPDYAGVENDAESIISLKHVELLIVKDMKLFRKVGQVTNEVALDLNRYKTPVKIKWIYDILKKLGNVLEECDLTEEEMTKPRLKQDVKVTVAENYYSIVKYLHRLKMFNQGTLCSFMLNYSLFLYFDTINFSSSHFLYFTKKTFAKAFELINVSKDFLHHNEERLALEVDYDNADTGNKEGRCYGFKNFNAVLLPSINNISFKATMIIESFLSRISNFLIMSENMVMTKDLAIKIKIFQEIYNDMFYYYYRFLRLLIGKYKRFYSHIQKETFLYKYYLVCFKNPKIDNSWLINASVQQDVVNHLGDLSYSECVDLKSFLQKYLDRDVKLYPEGMQNTSSELFSFDSNFNIDFQMYYESIINS